MKQKHLDDTSHAQAHTDTMTTDKVCIEQLSMSNHP